jgi:hypothetical protein
MHRSTEHLVDESPFPSHELFRTRHEAPRWVRRPTPTAPYLVGQGGERARVRDHAVGSPSLKLTVVLLE